jgi:hypothetical protein
MKKSKILVLIFLIACAVIPNSCQKELQLSNPNQFTTDLFWKTDNDFLSAFAATYKTFGAPWDGGYWNNKGIEIQNCRGDDMFMRNDVAEWYLIQSFLNDATQPVIGNLFNRLYIGIFRTNQILDKVDGAPISAASKKQYAAEAKFLRGLNYFYLVINWGAVPIHTTVPGQRNDYYQAKSTRDEVWKQVFQDLKDAKAGLPDAYSSEWVGRATKGAASGFLGKAYFYYAQFDPSYFALAQAEFAEIIASNKYQLLQNYGDNFRPEFDNNVESLFEYQFQKVGTGTVNWKDDGLDQSLGSVTAKELGPAEAGGWYEMYPTNKMFDEFQKEKTITGDYDPRMYASVVWDGKDANGDTLKYYTKNYNLTNFAQTSYTVKFKCRLRKYQNWWGANETSAPAGFDGVSEIDEKCLRYADILLMSAEALTMENKIDSAYTPLNQIRARANLAPLAAGFTQDQMMTEIRHQRMIEFFREGQRFYDLRRWGLLATEMANTDKENSDNYQTKYEYLPLPQKEIDANPNLTQNPPW